MDEANKSRIGIVILAAGASVRMGKPKQLLTFRGKTLIRNAAENALAVNGENVVVVLGANYFEIKKEIENLPLEIVVNENWQSGMASSLKTGLEKLLEIEPNLEAVLVHLGDQPLVNSSHLMQLTETFERTKSAIVASEYVETIGVPALFSRSMFTELLNLPADGAAKNLIRRNLSSVAKVRISEAAIDIDVPSDYEKLCADHQ